MLLADFGANVLRIDPPSTKPPMDLLSRRKRSLQINLRDPPSRDIFMKLLEVADVLIDPYRPGVLEGLGVVPVKVLEMNPRIVVARLTGFRRDGGLCVWGRG
jgi:alpha-methylacyl-CoA racemase